MTREEKQAFVAEMRDRLSRTEAIFLTDFTGLNVQAMTSLRREVKKVDGEFLVVKNRLLRRAMAETDMPDVSSYLTGPTGVVFSDESVVGAARVVVDFAKENDDRPVFKVGVLETNVLEPEDIVRVSRLPSREELLSEIAGALGGPMSALVAALSGKTQEMAGLIDALREALESQGSGS
ncbi:MAG: 50S ribosomal protein L10 [Gemmatimonadota bacterium]|nr:50S ribosomal protein L10 [Gemmatimonadota bacterium]MDE2783731.1 50S ribosomal protein L10 [Gemmatimonadota bacterium]MDE2863635.1 50S ribosomal protein L10 [Gemmatimonadota bacterium]MYB06035.1 50S ribosomal protein L10 [Gemmatimonadota bacterium]MYG23079.1 50S ribosomal protein L10 [Gemmatimonadota bacterium]